MHPSNDYYGHDMILSWAASIHPRGPGSTVRNAMPERAAAVMTSLLHAVLAVFQKSTIEILDFKLQLLPC